MRPVIFTCLLFVVFGNAANAQLSITPQIGIENTKTTVYYNELTGSVPLAGQLSPQFALRMDYKFKQQHGPFVGVSSSRSLVSYQFTDPENGMKMFKATPGDMQLRFEGGYQFSSKPFYFSKPSSTKKAVALAPSKVSQNKSYSSHYSGRGYCGSRSYNKAKEYSSSNAASSQAMKPKEKAKGWYVAVQPLLGAAVIPSVVTDIESKATPNQTTYVYNAGNWNTALITGAGFEFGKNVDKKFVVSIQYLKGLGNMDKRQISTMSGAKETITNLSSDVSAWSVKAGIPISLAKKKPVIKEVPAPAQQKSSEKKCGSYKMKCGRVI
jgi:hypothetical protein